MKLNRQRDLNKCGIYLIRNKVNQKVYIGKSINIYTRIKDHITALNRKNKNENIHLINSWHKYGKDCFEYEVLEYLERNDNILSEKELYWMVEYDSINRDKGYNLRLDSSTKCILPEETKKRMSEGTKKYYENNPEARKKIGDTSSKFWKENPEIKQQMAEKVSKAKHKFKIAQYTRDMKLIKIWNSVKDVTIENPEYKWQNIYSVCNGYKPTYRNFIWRKIKI